ncbi:MAG: GNAT family N-acetyltransferase [Nocardioides sp.]
MSPPPAPPAAPDHSVRVAWADDATAIAAAQALSWRERYPAVAGHPDPEPIAAAWAEALARPGDARNRVLVALDRQRVVGFAISAPAPDPDCDPVADAELSELTVLAADRGRGHGSRLLHAVADTMRADRFRRAVIWVDVGDDLVRRFLADAGWAPDGAHRELAAADPAAADDSGRVRQVRLHTSLAGGPDSGSPDAGGPVSGGPVSGAPLDRLVD